MAIDSVIGSGRNMAVYYKSLNSSKTIIPIMIYSRLESYRLAPKWIVNKMAFDMPYATHPLELCTSDDCTLSKRQHITHEEWLYKFKKYIQFVKNIYGNRTIWLLDMPLPILEKSMSRHIVQVFHGELFKIGPLPYVKEDHLPSLRSYGRILLSGRLLFDDLITYGKLNKHDARLRIVGRVLDDSLYSGALDRVAILRKYKLDPTKKTLLYSPTWESLKIWPIGLKSDDEHNLYAFCKFAQKHKLNVIIRAHPICIHQYGVKPKIQAVLKQFPNTYFDDSSESSHLGPNMSLIAADIMITDLSSISAEFLSLGKPVVFLYPDNTQGLWGSTYFPSIDEVANISYVVNTFEKLYTLLTRLIVHKESTKIVMKRQIIASYLLENRDGTAGKNFAREMESYAMSLISKDVHIFTILKNLLLKALYKKDQSFTYFSAHMPVGNILEPRLH